MKKSQLKIAVISIVALFLIGFGGLFYYASIKISPEEVRKMTLDSLEKMFPNANVKLGQINLNIGTSIKLDVEAIDITLKNEETNLLKVKDVNVNIPIFAILTGGGKVDIKIDGPSFNYIEYKNKNNWSLAQGDQKMPESKKSSSSKFVIPAILTQSKLNFKLTNVDVNYNLKNKQHGSLKLKKFILKNLNFKTSSAFELASELSYNLSKKEKINFSTLVIGSFDLSKFISDGKLESLIAVQLNDIRLPNDAYNAPNLKSNIKLTLEKSGKLHGHMDLSFVGENKISFNYNLLGGEVSLSKINGSLLLKDLLNVGKVNNSSIIPGGSNVLFSGSLGLDKKGHMNQDLSFNISPGFNYNLEGLNNLIELKGSYSKNNYKIIVNDKLLDGIVNIDVSGKLNINDLKSSKSIPPYIANIKINNLNVTEQMIQKILYSKDTTQPAATKVVANQKNKENEKKDSLAFALPMGSLYLNWDNVKLGKEDFEGKGKILIGRNSVATKNFFLSYGKGSGQVSFMTFMKRNEINNKLDFNLKNLNLDGLKPFLPSVLEDIKGDFTGTIKGEVSKGLAVDSLLKYDLFVNVKATDGELKGINFSDKVKSIVDNISLLKGKVDSNKIPKVDGNFEKLTLDGRFKHDDYQLSKFNFIGVNKKAEINGKGHIYPLPRKKDAHVELDIKYNEEKMSKQLTKTMGTDVIPILLKGIGMSLSPDYGYTFKKLAKSGGKKKVEEKVKKFLEDNGAKDKVKGLIKGFFK